MKFFFVILFSASIATAQSKAALAAKFGAYVQQKTESIEGDTDKDFRELTRVQLTENDLKLVQDALLVLVKLDNEDPSRTSVQILAQSYVKNKKLFLKAFQTIRTPENKEALDEIKSYMETINQGNG